MSITKESKEWLAALKWVPEKWQPNLLCMKQDGHQWCDIHNDDNGHDIPPPAITSDLLYAIRRAIEARGYTWVIRYTAGKNRSPNEAYSMTIFKDSTIVVHEDAATEDDAIIRAAANLQEAK